jgi:integrase
MQYQQGGRTVRASCQTESKELARDLLRAATGELSAAEKARKVLNIAARMTGNRFAGDPLVSELVADLLLWYRTDRAKPRFAKDCEAHWNNHLAATFGDWRASRITTDALRRYREQRLEEGAAPASINRELQVLRKAFRLAAKSDPPKVERVPAFTLPREDNARKRFALPEELTRLRAAASQEGLWFRCIFDLAVGLGWRRGELLGLRVSDVDLTEGTLRLQTSKNGEPRECPLSPDLAVLLQALVVGRAPADKLFPAGFDRAWNRVRDAAGCPHLIFHDLRRTSAKLKRAAGVDTSLTMAMMGWKSESLFRRYAIADQTDLRGVLKKQTAYEQTICASSGPIVH